MSEINITRQHGKTLAEARKAAHHLAKEMEDDLEMQASWEGDVLSFGRPRARWQWMPGKSASRFASDFCS